MCGWKLCHAACLPLLRTELWDLEKGSPKETDCCGQKGSFSLIAIVSAAFCNEPEDVRAKLNLCLAHYSTFAKEGWLSPTSTVLMGCILLNLSFP